MGPQGLAKGWTRAEGTVGGHTGWQLLAAWQPQGRGLAESKRWLAPRLSLSVDKRGRLLSGGRALAAGLHGSAFSFLSPPQRSPSTSLTCNVMGAPNPLWGCDG